MGAVGRPDLAEAERPARGGGRAVGLVEEPVVGSHRPVEPDRMVEARPDEVLPTAAEPGETRRQQGQVADEGERGGVHRRRCRPGARPPGTRPSDFVSG